VPAPPRGAGGGGDPPGAAPAGPSQAAGDGAAPLRGAGLHRKPGSRSRGFGGKAIHPRAPQGGISYPASLACATVALNEEGENMF